MLCIALMTARDVKVNRHVGNGNWISAAFRLISVFAKCSARLSLKWNVFLPARAKFTTL